MLIFGKPAFQDRDEEEVSGYRDALKLIHERGATLPISEATIKKLHKLSRGKIWDASKYKEKDIVSVKHTLMVAAEFASKSVPAKQTPKAMAQLIELWLRGMRERWVRGSRACCQMA